MDQSYLDGFREVRSPGVHGWTYFIRVGDAIKIGFASNYKKRIASLQTSHEKPLEVLAVVPASTADEYKTHQLFARLRIRGEWFRADQELLYFIEGLKGASALPEPVAGGPEPSPTMQAHDMIRRLHALRKAYGPKTPMGHTISNIPEQTDELQTYVRPEWATDERQTLPYMLHYQLQRYERLKAAAN